MGKRNIQMTLFFLRFLCCNGAYIIAVLKLIMLQDTSLLACIQLYMLKEGRDKACSKEQKEKDTKICNCKRHCGDAKSSRHCQTPDYRLISLLNLAVHSTVSELFHHLRRPSGFNFPFRVIFLHLGLNFFLTTSLFSANLLGFSLT